MAVNADVVRIGVGVGVRENLLQQLHFKKKWPTKSVAKCSVKRLAEAFLDDGDEQSDRHRNPDWCLDCIRWRSEETSDPKVVLDRLEAKFHLLAVLVARADSGDQQCYLIGEEGERMSERGIESPVLHEEGEVAAGRLHGEDWALKLAGFTGKRAELLARAVRDNFADCLVTLPGLLQRDATDSLHFWFSTFDGLRRELLPRLVDAYSIVGTGDTALLADVAEAGRIHFAALGLRLLDMDEVAIAALSHEAAAIAL